ncbi:Follistatin- protein 1 [Branchiostoma belcheri]|nr:Follistatin- protein 1 [Branchiostoma belcheri]
MELYRKRKLPQVKPDVCANVMCGAGRECTEKDGEPTCICIRKCPSHNKPVCGSNAKSYINHCELHKHACEAGIKIQIKYSGKCKEGEVDDTAVLPTVKPTKPSQPTNDVVPVVCFAQNRNCYGKRSANGSCRRLWLLAGSKQEWASMTSPSSTSSPSTRTAMASWTPTNSWPL